ncbi:hypothetical protein [Streptomyces panaciradicis]|uniref:hypothetical protein n=1 Tax=Streptomyces panaciradicis TaxID=1470261 RepID=UPI00201CC87A|nr:hypothetical protein [Streptomyces panaciradicis]MCL6670125.1 hypothetical protein [Streptomyces panaciradicis]
MARKIRQIGPLAAGFQPRPDTARRLRPTDEGDRRLPTRPATSRLALGRAALVFAAFAALFGLQQGNACALEATCFTADGDAGGKCCYVWHQDSTGQRVDSVKFDALGECLTIAEGTSVKLESCQTDNGKEYDCHTEWAVA